MITCIRSTITNSCTQSSASRPRSIGREKVVAALLFWTLTRLHDEGVALVSLKALLQMLQRIRSDILRWTVLVDLMKPGFNFVRMPAVSCDGGTSRMMKICNLNSALDPDFSEERCPICQLQDSFTHTAAVPGEPLQLDENSRHHSPSDHLVVMPTASSCGCRRWRRAIC